jgi:hypothetical protein
MIETDMRSLLLMDFHFPLNEENRAAECCKLALFEVTKLRS